MSATESYRRTWLILGLCFTLGFSLGADVVEAKKKSSDRCEGTKSQRKQKMEKREIADEQFQQMVERYRQEISTDLEHMKQTAVRRLEREYEASRTSGQLSALVAVTRARSSRFCNSKISSRSVL